MNALLLLALLAAPKPDAIDGCFTKCGLMAPLESGQTCTELQAYEDATLAAYAAHVEGWSYDKTCPALKGWSVLVHPDVDRDGAWPISSTQNLLGLTIVEYRIVLVGRRDWSNSALAHELAHVLERHFAGPKKDVGNHKNWTERGICDAVNQVSLRFRNNCKAPGFSTVLPDHSYLFH
ncbi:MAG: hypothetical protein NVS3B25_09790 [Hymenobacter sp.]